jgi:hypothetical protein
MFTFLNQHKILDFSITKRPIARKKNLTERSVIFHILELNNQFAGEMDHINPNFHCPGPIGPWVF